MHSQSFIVLGAALCVAAAPMYQVLPQAGQPMGIQSFSTKSRVTRRGDIEDAINTEPFKTEDIYPFEAPQLKNGELAEDAEDAEAESRISRSISQQLQPLQSKDFLLFLELGSSGLRYSGRRLPTALPKSSGGFQPLSELTLEESLFVRELPLAEVDIPEFNGSVESGDLSVGERKAFVEAVANSELPGLGKPMLSPLAKAKSWFKAISKMVGIVKDS